MSAAFLSDDPADFIHIDTETRSSVDVTVGGAWQHLRHGKVTIVTYAIGDGEVKDWVLPTADLSGRLHWDDAPADLAAAFERVKSGEAWFVAWNAAFDRIATSLGMDGATMKIEWWIDAMAQAVKSHLPPDLLRSSRLVAGTDFVKDTEGKRLIKLFARHDGGTPETHPDDWAHFRQYAIDDVGSSRGVFDATMPLSRLEWEEYWASERINDRGLPVDVDFVRQAGELAKHSLSLANQQVIELSGGDLYSVNQNEAMLAWVLNKLRGKSEVESILTREINLVPSEDGDDVVKEAKMSLSRDRVEQLIAYLERVDDEAGLTDDEYAALQMLEVRLYGASATPRKFVKMLPMIDGGRVRGQYVFNGAAATGRFSSRGVQVHNLTRSTVGSQDDELDAIETIQDLGAAAYEPLRDRFGPVGRTLSRLIRPSIIAPEGKTFVWCDWSAIEARVLPWLANAEGMLDIFRTNDKDPSLPDVYKVTAGGILGKEPTAVTKAERQSHGKVPVLALGFGGGIGALFAMATAYGASFTEEEAKKIVADWRRTNAWAPRFWDRVWDAVQSAIDEPGEVFPAGRLQYVCIDGYMRRTLACILPCGRALLYPDIRWQRRQVKDKKTGETEERLQLTYARGLGRAPVWYGTFVENATQAVAGSLMRRAIWRMDNETARDVVFHTHDEIGIEVLTQDVADGRAALEYVMLDAPDWADGLPLAAESSVSEYYTKTVD